MDRDPLTYEVVPATLAHARDLAGRLRPLDRRECEGQGLPVRKVLHRTLRGSLFAQTAVRADGCILAMWGMGGSLVGNEGNPWLLTAPEVERLPVAIVREARYAVAEMLALRPFLWNYVLADYAGAIRLLGILGFTVDAPQLVERETFRRFWMRR